MIKKSAIILLIVFFVSITAHAQGNSEVEIFNINEGQVVKRVETSPAVQKEAEGYLKNISGIVVSFRPFPERGFIIRIPLKPSVKVENQWFSGTVDEVFVIFPERGNPFLLILDGEGRPFFYTFEGRTDKLLELLDYQQQPR